MPYEKFKNITDGIHNIAIALALIVGGAWTLYTFWSLGARQKAENDRQKAQDELFKQAVVNISIDCKQRKIRNEYYIQANVKIVNLGKRNTFLNFEKPPCQVSKFYFNSDGTSEAGMSIEQDNLRTESTILRSGATLEYPLVIKVNERGFYLVEFKVPLNDTEFKEHQMSGGPDGDTIYWRGYSTILIE